MSALANRILFVDDEAQWRDQVGTSLASAGFEVMTASDGTEAMRQAAAASPALMIVDEDLAGESGVILAKFLRHNYPGVPLILYTSTEHDAEATLNLTHQAADQCLAKGSIEELIITAGSYVR